MHRHRFSIRLLGESLRVDVTDYLLKFARQSVLETRIYLHRASFIRAIQQNPSDPSRIDQRFHQSFTAVFESAGELISIVKQMVVFHPSLVAR